MFSPSSPVTGAAQTGLTSPTYTLTADVAPDVNGKQFAVTALGGTQAGVNVHTSSCPFTITGVRPKQFRSLGAVDPITGALRSVPMNTFKIHVRKGVTVLAGQPIVTSRATVTFEIPAGSDVTDPAEIRAMLSLLIGTLSQVSSSWGDTLVSGIL